MKKVSFCFFTFIFGIINTFGQDSFSVKGRVLGEDSIPVVSATVVLQNDENEPIFTIATDADGKFVFQGMPIGNKYTVLISFIDMQTAEFDFDAVTKDIDLGNIILQKTPIELKEITVKAPKIKILDDRKIVYPTLVQKEQSGDGVTLLNALKLPKLSIVPGSKNVKYWGRNGDLKFYINDVPASVEQILSLASKDISYIEYIDNPDIRYGNAGLVINYVVKKYESGITGSLNSEKWLNRPGFSAGAETKFNYKNSEFAIRYGFYTDKDTRDFNETHEEFNFLNGDKLARHNKKLKTLSKGCGHDVALLYTYTKPKKELFYAKSIFNYSRIPKDDNLSELYSNGIKNDTLHMFSTENNKIRTLYNEIFYRKKIGKQNTLEVKFYHFFYDISQHSIYQEGKSTAINSIVDGKSYETQFSAGYNTNIGGKKNTLQNIDYVQKNRQYLFGKF